MKAFTDIEQSEKLAEILPLESADMHYNVVGDAIIGDYQSGISSAKSVAKAYRKNPDEFAKSVIPCWSLAALLSVLPNNEHIETTISRGSWKIDTTEYLPNTWWCEYEDDNENQNEFHIKSSDNPVDACVDMIIKLHEQNIL